MNNVLVNNLKTAGTSYPEALRTIAEFNPDLFPAFIGEYNDVFRRLI